MKSSSDNYIFRIITFSKNCFKLFVLCWSSLHNFDTCKNDIFHHKNDTEVTNFVLFQNIFWKIKSRDMTNVPYIVKSCMALLNRIALSVIDWCIRVLIKRRQEQKRHHSYKPCIYRYNSYVCFYTVTVIQHVEDMQRKLSMYFSDYSLHYVYIIWGFLHLTVSKLKFAKIKAITGYECG